MLIWDFYRAAGKVDSTGGVLHYFDEQSQSVFLSGGMKTRVSEVEKGHWEQAVAGGVEEITAAKYDQIAFDHPANGTVHGVAVRGDDLFYLRHLYAMELSPMCQSGSLTGQIDSPIKQLNLTVKNIAAHLFTADNTLFNPGAKLTLSFSVGDSFPYEMGVAYLDEVTFDGYSDTVPLSGRNGIGYLLSGHTFDEQNRFYGSRGAAFGEILRLAGVSKAIVQQDGGQASLEFEPDTDILTGLTEALTAIGWRLVDLPDGTMVLGDDLFLGQYLQNSRYTFHGGKEVFKRQTGKSADAAYTRVAVKDRDGNCVYRPVAHWKYWKLGQNKTKYYEAPEGATPGEMAKMAEDYARSLQYVGIGESFSSPLRPQLLPGDIAEIYETGDSEAVSLGLVTELSHNFGESGFYTDFSIDSGGSATNSTDYTIVSRAAILDGYNRKQRVIDLVGLVSGKKAVSVFSGGGRVIVYSVPAEAVSTAPAGIMRIF